MVEESGDFTLTVSLGLERDIIGLKGGEVKGWDQTGELKKLPVQPMSEQETPYSPMASSIVNCLTPVVGEHSECLPQPQLLRDPCG